MLEGLIAVSDLFTAKALVSRDRCDVDGDEGIVKSMPLKPDADEDPESLVLLLTLYLLRKLAVSVKWPYRRGDPIK